LELPGGGPHDLRAAGAPQDRHETGEHELAADPDARAEDVQE
jgi:hypothetical protein